jgi:hypothetical protein
LHRGLRRVRERARAVEDPQLVRAADLDTGRLGRAVQRAWKSGSAASSTGRQLPLPPSHSLLAAVSSGSIGHVDGPRRGSPNHGPDEITTAVSKRPRVVRVEDETRERSGTMQQYLFSIYQPDGERPPPEFLEPIERQLDALNADLKAAGAWVFAAGLHDPSTATVLRATDDEVLMTDGPYLEGKEHLGGFSIIEAEDLDAALVWARRLATIVKPLNVEVRPFLSH